MGGRECEQIDDPWLKQEWVYHLVCKNKDYDGKES